MSDETDKMLVLRAESYNPQERLVVPLDNCVLNTLLYIFFLYKWKIFDHFKLMYTNKVSLYVYGLNS